MINNKKKLSANWGCPMSDDQLLFTALSTQWWNMEKSKIVFGAKFCTQTLHGNCPLSNLLRECK